MKRISQTLLLCAALCSPMMAEEQAAPWPLQIQDRDKLVLSNGNSILGTIEKIRDDGAIVFTSAGSTGSIAYLPTQFRSYSFRRTAGDILSQRVAYYLQDMSDPTRPLDLLATLRWAQEQKDDGISDQISDLASKSAVAAPTHIPLIEFALELNPEEEAPIRRESILRAAVKANPTWEPGYDYLLDLFLVQNKMNELDKAIELTLQHRRNHHLANRLYADSAMVKGNIAEAREAYRKASANNDVHALLGFGTASLMMREWNGAERTAQQLITIGEHSDAALVILGTVRLSENNFAEALELFENASGGESLEAGPLKTIARHNYGLALSQSGQSEQAAAVFAENEHIASDLAAKMIRGEAVTDNRIFNNPILGAVASEYSVIKALEDGDISSSALLELDPDTQPRHRFLYQLQGVLADQGKATRVRALALTQGQESAQWQLYGHMLAKRWDKAWELAEALSADDGYALVAKSFIRASTGDTAEAGKIYREQVQPMAQSNIGSPVPPSNYVAVLAAEFDVAEGAYRRYDFAWPDGERLGPGWNSSQEPGSGITTSVKSQQLTFQGSASAVRPGLARAWCRVRESEFERVILEATYPQSDIRVAAGLEVLDGDRENGIAVSVEPNQSLRWRQLNAGRWGSWRNFSPQINLAPGEHLTLLYRSPGRVQILNSNKQVVGIGEPFTPSGHLSVSIFADPQEAGDWSFSANQLDIGQRSQ